MPSHEDWKRAVVHLELAAHHDDRSARFRGSGTLISHRGQPFLVTARHVLTNETMARADLDAMYSGQYTELQVDDWIFNMIMRVPSLEEPPGRPVFLMNMSAGPRAMRPYLFDKEADLAVVALDTWQQDFVSPPGRSSSVPIESAHISGTGPSGDGADVLAIGYPDSVAALVERSLGPGEDKWSSRGLSLPVTSWGRVSMTSDRLRYFWADLTVYPGNSGGPVVEGERMVGVVSGQATVEGTRVPFAWVSRSERVLSLLDELDDRMRKERLW